MPWREAFREMMFNNRRIRRREWDLEKYWAWEGETIMIHLPNGDMMDIRGTDNVAYTFFNIASDDWEIIE